MLSVSSVSGVKRERQIRQASKKLSHQAKGLAPVFAAIPIIVNLKLVYDHHVLQGTVVSIVLASGVMELARKNDQGLMATLFIESAHCIPLAV